MRVFVYSRSWYDDELVVVVVAPTEGRALKLLSELNFDVVRPVSLTGHEIKTSTEGVYVFRAGYVIDGLSHK